MPDRIRWSLKRVSHWHAYEVGSGVLFGTAYTYVRKTLTSLAFAPNQPVAGKRHGGVDRFSIFLKFFLKISAGDGT